MSELETYSASMSLLRSGRDYEIETLFEAQSAKQAALTFVRDWADLIKTCLSQHQELVISVSSPNGDLEFFTVHSNLCMTLSQADTIQMKAFEG